MLYIWCQECEQSIVHSTSHNAYSQLAVAEQIAKLTLAMKKHQANVHDNTEVTFEMKVSIAGDN